MSSKRHQSATCWDARAKSEGSVETSCGNDFLVLATCLSYRVTQLSQKGGGYRRDAVFHIDVQIWSKFTCVGKKETGDMTRTFICSIALVVLLSTVGAAALTITTEDGNGADTYLTNDGQQGPDTNTGAEVRMRAFRQLADTRSKTGYIRFDLGDAAGDMSGATLTFEATFLKGSEKTVEVYGLLDGEHDSWDESTITYNTAPGVLTTTLGNCAIDPATTTLLGTIVTPAAGDPYPVSFTSDPVALPLADFLGWDTNGLVTFIFVGANNEGEIASKEHATFAAPTLTLPNAGLWAATDPGPLNGATDVPLDAVLSWKTGVDPTDANMPNPAITGHYLWLSPPYDPDNPPSRTAWWTDPLVQTILIDADTDPADGQVDETASYKPADLKRDGFYYWAVDESLNASGPDDIDNLLLGKTWSFQTVTSAPVVDAGSSIVTWLKDGSTTVSLDGTVTDETGDVTATTWSVVAGPNDATVSIADASATATTATLTVMGQYTLQLYAVDAKLNEDADQMQIDVYGDSCEAAKNNPNGYVAPLYDLNDDCRVDFSDYAAFATIWLQDESLTEDILYEP